MDMKPLLDNNNLTVDTQYIVNGHDARPYFFPMGIPSLARGSKRGCGATARGEGTLLTSVMPETSQTLSQLYPQPSPGSLSTLLTIEIQQYQKAVLFSFYHQ